MTRISQYIELVKGIFSPIEAADILFSLISDKIKFHNLQVLQANKADNAAVAHSEKRVSALKEAKNIAKDLILKARDEDYEIKINGIIEIELIKMDAQL